MLIKELCAADRDDVHEMLVACRAFSDEEVRVALEVLDAGLAGGLTGDYPLFAAEIDGKVCGYVCVGKTPLTAATWHLYWICVHPRAQGQGTGSALLRYAEAFIRASGGARLVLETSGRLDYAAARRFYLQAGYREAGRIKDFYKIGDDCILYAKSLIEIEEASAGETSLFAGVTSRKGRGIFAQRSILKGELIEEAPVVVIPSAQVPLLDQTTLGDYYFLWGNDEQEAAVMLGSCSLCNHCYEPNAIFILDPGRLTIRFVACRDIESGEEITINYNGLPEDRRAVWFDVAES
jgi:ribosomal protein S18 acetylase RimI-like enzyme